MDSIEYQDFVFLKPQTGELKKIPHSDYVALTHREKVLPEYGGQTLRIAVLYATVEKNKPCHIKNATYSLIRFDENGFADSHFDANSIEDNCAFYRAVADSDFDDIDCDPEIKKIRTKLGQEFSWHPTQKELEEMISMIMGN